MESGAGNPPERFFNEITPLVYDLQFRPDAPDVAFWVEWCKETGGPVLELGCGNGRVTIPLARAGLEVAGIDLSEPMLKVAGERLGVEAPEAQRRVRFLHGDMQGPLPVGPFRCAIIPARTFLVLLTRKSQEQVLWAVRGILTEGGLLAFDLPVAAHGPLSTVGELPPVRRTAADGTIDFMEERSVDIDIAAGIATSTITYTFHQPKNLGQITERVRGRIVECAEVQELLAHSGYTVQELWGDYDRSQFTEESGLMIFVARKAR